MKPSPRLRKQVQSAAAAKQSLLDEDNDVKTQPTQPAAGLALKNVDFFVISNILVC